MKETTSWQYEYGVRRADGSVRVSANGTPWNSQQAESWRQNYDNASVTLGQKPGARVIRRKVYTTTIVRREGWTIA